MKSNVWAVKAAVFVLSVMILGAGAPAYAEHGKMGHPKGDHGRSGGGSIEDKYFSKYHFFMKHREELGLNEQQMEALKAIKWSVKRATVEADAKKELAELDLWEEMHKDAPAVETVNAAIDAKMAAKTGLAKTLAKAILDSKAVLGPEQAAKMKEIWYREQFKD
jgi:hypothetical protein